MRNAINSVMEYMVYGEKIVRATKYLSDKQVVRAVRRTYNGKILKRANIEVVLTIGRPNYAEREFIKKCKKAGEPFPVAKIQVKHEKLRKKK